MAKLMTEVVADLKNSLDRTNALLETKAAEDKVKEEETPLEETKAEEVKEDETKTEEVAEETPETPEEEEVKEVTREEFDALLKRIEDLEKKLAEKDAEAEETKEIIEKSTEALKRVNAYFRDPSNRAQFAEGVDPTASSEATTTDDERNVRDVWLSMPKGSRESRDFFAKHKTEILNLL